MRTPITTVHRLSVTILLVSLASTAFAGLREVSTLRWQATTNGGLSTAKNSSASVPKSNAGGNAQSMAGMLGQSATIPQRLQTDTDTNYTPGEIIVKLRQNSQAAAVLDRAHAANRSKAASLTLTETNELAETNELSVLLKKHRVSSARTLFSSAKREAGGGRPQAKTVKETKRDGLFRWCRVQVPQDADLKQVLADFKANPAVEYAEPVMKRRLDQWVPPPITGLPDGTTDPQINQQWHLNAVHAQAAWNYLKEQGVPVGGNRDVIVAVIDTGVDYNHEELVGNMWTNPREIPGNGIDDDGNGFVDDIHGCSVVSDARSHGGDPIDLHGHGTHVAGIIAATAFNHKGGVGVAFNVQIMAIRAADYSGNLTTTDISEAILYAVDNGAEVINMSFGGYQRSQIEEDALAVALNQAVLVAAAGNDGLPAWKNPIYPAALPFVHGVMATTPDGRLAWFSNTGYDLGAPGEGIFSTLPGNQYAAWSGTSMATPVVSGIAALMRSYYWQRDIYSTRFLMGGLWAAGSDPATGGGTVINAFRALTELPAPGVTMLENWLFDDKDISPRNDADGRVDSGETIHLAIEVMNRSGQAENVVATLRAHAEGAVFDDPYITLLTNTVSYGDIGPFNTSDNGFIYNAGGVITGVARPFVFQVASNCPNDHVIQFELNITFEDGWNPSSPGPYERISRFSYIVQRGKNVPQVISTNTVLSADEFWMVASPVLIEPGVTLTIGPGTQVQWGAISDDPYNPGPQNGNIIVRGNLQVAGTSNQPVSFFPSYLVAGQVVSISIEGAGTADMAYVNARNPNMNGLRNIDHGYFDWDYGYSVISAAKISNSIFHKLRGGGGLTAQVFDGCLFDAGWLAPNSATIQNCTFLQDNENNRPVSIGAPASIEKALFGGAFQSGDDIPIPIWVGLYHCVTRNGFTYVTLPAEKSSQFQEAELIAQYFGGHITSIADQAEQTFLENYITEPDGVSWVIANTGPYFFIIGLSDEGNLGNYRWLDGSPVNYLNWDAGYPIALPEFSKGVVALPKTQLRSWMNMDEFVAYRSHGQYFSAPAFILKLPGTWTADQLNTQVTNGNALSFVRQHFQGPIIYNAFLSKYWDPNLNHWMRVQAGGGNYSSMNFNYWGTTSTALIDHMIVDYYDNFTSSRVDYAPAPTNGFTTTYPFVEKVLIGGIPAETVPQLSAGRVDFTVVFNRDMNTNNEPFVTFGPSPPHTDFSVTPRDADFHEMTNGWLNARTWQGAAWITPVTGEGYQLMRISGAVAADDPWLVSGYDVGRFRFEVRTMGIASMTLQANGQEGSIQLTWQQNDFDLLAGYNLYRADSTNGPWTRLNATVIPPGSESFTDTNVPPAVPKFYKFTVLTTDMTESEPSNLAMASALDTIAPVLTHTPITSALPARGLRLSATATDNLRVTGVTLFYRFSGSGSNYASMAMVNVASNDWSATIPGSAVQSPGVDYYITATDGISEVFSGTPTLPHIVLVNNVPTLGSVTPNHGPSIGGTAVTLSGTLFEPGMSVLFGGVLASNVTLLSDNQLICLTPPHFPASVDVTVANTNGTQSTLLSAFQFEQTGVIVAMPVTNGNYGTQVELGLSAANVAGLRGVDVTITFDPTVLSALDARAGLLTAGWALSANLNTPGRAVLSLANASSVTGSGSLVLLRFNIVKAPPASTTLAIESVSLNDGAMTATRSDGSFTVNGFFTLAGTVRYFGGSQMVPGASLDLVGAGAFQTTSATNGEFSITNIPTGSYVITPSKTNQVAEITGYDAALVLQAAAGLLTLSSNQFLAADVNRNGMVSAMDASYILEKAVGLIEGSFPGAGRLWDFTPTQRSYSLLNSDQSGQDFTAVLIGDVSGNWMPPTNAEGASLSPLAKQSGGGVSMRGAKSPSSVVIGMDNGPLPGTVGERNARVLLNATHTSVYSIDLVMSYAPTNRAVAEVRRGGLAGGMVMAANTNQAGLVRASLASATPLSDCGSLLIVSFVGSDPVEWYIDQASINENQVPTVLDVALTTFDTDGDGLIDEDEVELFHTDPARCDTDGDGMPDGAEVRAGTDPLNKGDVFAVTKADTTNGLVRLEWAAKSNKSYQVMKSFDLQSWTNAPDGVDTDQQSLRTSVTNGLLNYVDPASATSGAPQAFYRVRLVE